MLELLDLLLKSKLVFGLAICVISLAFGVMIGRGTKRNRGWLDDPHWMEDPDKVRYRQMKLKRAGILW